MKYVKVTGRDENGKKVSITTNTKDMKFEVVGERANVIASKETVGKKVSSK